MTKSQSFKLTVFLSVLLALAAQVPAQRTSRDAASLSLTQLQKIDGVVNEEIAQRHLPGAVVLVGRNGQVAWRKAYGSRATEPANEPMTTDTIFDVAEIRELLQDAMA